MTETVHCERPSTVAVFSGPLQKPAQHTACAQTESHEPIEISHVRPKAPFLPFASVSALPSAAELC